MSGGVSRGRQPPRFFSSIYPAVAAIPHQGRWSAARGCRSIEPTMTISIRPPRGTSELDAVFALRHRVYVEEERYFARRRGARIADRFDAFPTTLHVLAFVDGVVAGSLRVTEPSCAGHPADEFFDFAPFLSGA